MGVDGPRLQITITFLNTSGGFFDPRRPSGSVLDGLYIAHPGRTPSVCDGVEDVRKRVRELIHLGADVIKAAASGSPTNPADEFFLQFTYEVREKNENKK